MSVQSQIERIKNTVNSQTELIQEISNILDSKSTPTQKLQDKTITPTATNQVITADTGYGGLNKVTVNGDAELVPENIKEGVNIFGVTGSMSGGINSSIPLLDGWTTGDTTWLADKSIKAPDAGTTDGEDSFVIPNLQAKYQTLIFLWWLDEYSNGEIWNIEYLWKNKTSTVENGKIACNVTSPYCSITTVEQLNNGFKMSFASMNGTRAGKTVHYAYNTNYAY